MSTTWSLLVLAACAGCMCWLHVLAACAGFLLAEWGNYIDCVHNDNQCSTSLLVSLHPLSPPRPLCSTHTVPLTRVRCAGGQRLRTMPAVWPICLVRRSRCGVAHEAGAWYVVLVSVQGESTRVRACVCPRARGTGRGRERATHTHAHRRGGTEQATKRARGRERERERERACACVCVRQTQSHRAKYSQGTKDRAHK